MTAFTHPHFAEPRWLWLAVAGPLALLALQRYSDWRRGQHLARVVGPEFLAGLTRSFSPLRAGFKELLLLLAVAGAGLALARPQWGEREDSGQLLGQDMVFILDCSRSMLATDVTPSRLQRAKLAILDYVQHHGRGRVGLVAFAGQAFLQCPLTFDYGAFQDTLLAVDDQAIPVPGTDIARGLDESFRSMDTSDRLKLMVLITDGEDLEKGGVRMAESLAKQGVVIFTIGVGTAAGSEIRMANAAGQSELVRDRNGEVVRSRLDESTLRAIAQATRGAYFPLGPLGEGLSKVRLAVEDLSTRSGAGPGRRLGVDRFHWPLGGVLVLLLAESLVGTRRSGARRAAV
jgi:Ca-activated chloride channel homolog